MDYRQWALDRGLTFRWSDDWEVGSHTEYFGPGSAYEDREPDTCEQCDLIDDTRYRDVRILVSLGCVDDADEEYRRIVENDMAQEYHDHLMHTTGVTV